MEEKETQKALRAAAPSFTPGPWEPVMQSDPRGQPSSMYRGLVALVEQGDRSLAVVLGRGHRQDGVPEQQWEPNMHLIAAAPELYEALLGAVRVHGCAHGLGACDAPWCVEARSVLAKAEGRAAERSDAPEALPSRGTP